MLTTFAVAAYIIAMTAANLLVAEFGRVVVPLNAFLLIGLDLALRDWLHVRLRPWQMAAVIVVGGFVTLAANPAASHIALASATAFIAAASIDWGVFSAARGSWQRRANLSNVAGAAVDSLVFPLIAFGGLDPLTVGGMFAAKVAGGAMWAWMLSRRSIAAMAPSEKAT
jgi:uncharacterized PurR-regulated membrane protein YhhQ (DUF165 family)